MIWGLYNKSIWNRSNRLDLRLTQPKQLGSKEWLTINSKWEVNYDENGEIEKKLYNKDVKEEKIPSRVLYKQLCPMAKIWQQLCNKILLPKKAQRTMVKSYGNISFITSKQVFHLTFHIYFIYICQRLSWGLEKICLLHILPVNNILVETWSILHKASLTR